MTCNPFTRQVSVRTTHGNTPHPRGIKRSYCSQNTHFGNVNQKAQEGTKFFIPSTVSHPSMIFSVTTLDSAQAFSTTTPSECVRPTMLVPFMLSKMSPFCKKYSQLLLYTEHRLQLFFLQNTHQYL